MLHHHNDYTKLHIVPIVSAHRKWSVGIITVCHRVTNWMHTHLELNSFAILTKRNSTTSSLITCMLLESYSEIRNNQSESLSEIINN